MAHLYRAKHRRTLPTDSIPFYELDRPDPSYSEATCSGMGSFPDPGHVFCPRHEPAAYSEMMARHATDSLR